MPNTFSESADRVMALLHNARKMAVIRQDRRLAADVLKACSLYIRKIGFPFDHAILDDLATAIVDKSNPALLSAFAKVEEKLKTTMVLSGKKPWKTIRMPR